MDIKSEGNAILLSGLKKHFGRTRAVDGLSFEVPRGQVTAFLGSNGAGKSTTIQTIMNLHKPTAGSVEVLGVDSCRLGPTQLQRIGYVSENMELPLWMTVKSFLDYCRPFYPSWDQAFAEQLLEEFQLPLDRKLRNLSRGMRMKAALIGGIAYRPELVVLDEPFSGLDPLVRDEFIRGLLRLTGEEGWTVFLSSHDIDEVERLADRVVLIDSGQKKMEESVERLLETSRQVEVACGDLPKDFQPHEDWLGYRRAGRSISFAVFSFDGDEAALRAAFPPSAVDRLAVREMSLREVFVSMAARWQGKEGV